MARPTAESERITAFSEPRQQLQTQVSDRSFRITPPRKSAAAQAVAVVDRICATARGLLRMTAILLASLSIVFCSIAHAGLAPGPTVKFTVGQVVVAAAGLLGPSGVAVDGSGNVYIADTDNHRVLKETLSAGNYTESTVVSSGLGAPRGVAVDGVGNVYIADSGNNVVLKETLSGGSYTQSTVGAGLSYPFAVAVDQSGDVYIADSNNNRVLKETPSPGSYTQSNVATGLSSPSGVVVDGSGNVYISDAGNHRVLKETLSGGNYTPSTVPTIGLDLPFGVAVDASGNVYIADTYNNQALKETLSGGSYTQSTVGTGLSDPYGIAVDVHGNVYIADSSHNRILDLQTGSVDLGSVDVGVTAPSVPLTFTFVAGGTLGSTAVLTQGATGLDFANAGTGSCTAGTVYENGDTCTIAVTLTPGFPGARLGAAELLAANGSVLATALLTGTGVGPQVNFLPGEESTVAPAVLKPQGVAVDGSGNIYIADYSNSEVLKETPSGAGYTQSTVASASSPLGTPAGVTVDQSGNLYVADSANNKVLKETLSGGGYTQSTAFSGLSSPNGVAIDGSGNIYIANTGADQVLKETLSGGAYTQSTVASSSGGMVQPFGVAVDESGNIYIADFNGQQVLKETLSGGAYTQSTLLSASSGLGKTTWVTVDAHGNLYIADYTNNRVLKETLSGGSYIETTVPTGSSLSNPFGVAVDGPGNVFISDVGNQRVVKEDFADPPALVFAATDVGSTSADSPQTVTVSNIGNAALTFPVPGSGSNPTVSSAFPMAGSTTCPEVASSGSGGSLAAGSSCVYAINFTPIISGADVGFLQLTDTNLNAAGPTYATQSVPLSGTGIALPDATHTVASAAPDPVTVTQPTTLTVVVTDTTRPPTVPTGSVSFTDSVGTTVVSLNNGTAVPLVAGTATLQVTPTVVGTHTITANFVGTAAPAPTVRLEPHKANPSFASSSGTATLAVTAIVPTLSFGPIAAKTYGNPPFAVSATSASSGAVTYTASGPATIAGNTVTLTGAGTVVLSASQAASGNYAAATANASITVAAAAGATVPTLTFAPIPAPTFGNAPFAVSATSASSGAVTYIVVSGPATIAGNIVTLTGAGTVMLSASQAASGNYAGATATVSFMVAAAPGAMLGFTLTTSGGSGVETALPGGAAAFNLMLATGSGSPYPDALTLSATGLPGGATVTFSPATIPAGSGATPITMTIQTFNQQTAHGAKPFLGGSLGSICLAFLLLPTAGIKRVRRRLRRIPGLPVVLAAAALSVGAMVCLSGCASNGFFNQAAKSYTVAVSATDVVTGAHSSTNVTLTVQ